MALTTATTKPVKSVADRERCCEWHHEVRECGVIARGAAERADRGTETEEDAHDDTDGDRDGEHVTIAPRAHQLLDQRIRVSSHLHRVAHRGGVG